MGMNIYIDPLEAPESRFANLGTLFIAVTGIPVTASPEQFGVVSVMSNFIVSGNRMPKYPAGVGPQTAVWQIYGQTSVDAFGSLPVNPIVSTSSLFEMHPEIDPDNVPVMVPAPPASHADPVVYSVTVIWNSDNATTTTDPTLGLVLPQSGVYFTDYAEVTLLNDIIPSTNGLASGLSYQPYGYSPPGAFLGSQLQFYISVDYKDAPHGDQGVFFVGSGGTVTTTLGTTAVVIAQIDDQLPDAVLAFKLAREKAVEGSRVAGELDTLRREVAELKNSSFVCVNKLAPG
jgi:hypothetical protein